MLDLSLLDRLGRPIHYHRVIDTTMREAARLAGCGEPAGALVIAEEQTAGRGRLGRRWVSEPGSGLYFSLILRPAIRPADAAVCTLALGLAVSQAIRRCAGLACDLRWPNDVLISGRKCFGILSEMVEEEGRLEYLVAGIGINVNQERFPPDLAATATSLRLQTGCEYSREALLAQFLEEADRHLAILLQSGPAAIVELFARASSYARGKHVAVSNGASEMTGETAGITPAGVLLLRRPDGSVAPILAGSVRPLE